jgi:hypothetical protein
MQDRTSANSMKVLLQRAAGPYIGVRTGSALVEHKIFASSPKTRHLRTNESMPFCNGLDEAILDQAGLELLATCC